MIKINLAKRKTAAIASGEGEPSSGGIFSGLFNRSSGGASSGGSTDWKALPIRSLLIALAGTFGAQFYFESEKASALQGVEDKITQAKSQQTELQAQLAKTQGFEELKASLEADEKLVRTKLDTIMSLMQNRQASATALKGISLSIPSEVWLSELNLSQTEFNVSGQALDYNQVSDFMNRLGQADFLTDLNLDGSTQAKDEKGLNVASFRLTAKRK